MPCSRIMGAKKWFINAMLFLNHASLLIDRCITNFPRKFVASLVPSFPQAMHIGTRVSKCSYPINILFLHRSMSFDVTVGAATGLQQAQRKTDYVTTDLGGCDDPDRLKLAEAIMSKAAKAEERAMEAELKLRKCKAELERHWATSKWHEEQMQMWRRYAEEWEHRHDKLYQALHSKSEEFKYQMRALQMQCQCYAMLKTVRNCGHLGTDPEMWSMWLMMQGTCEQEVDKKWSHNRDCRTQTKSNVGRMRTVRYAPWTWKELFDDRINGPSSSS